MDADPSDLRYSGKAHLFYRALFDHPEIDRRDVFNASGHVLSNVHTPTEIEFRRELIEWIERETEFEYDRSWMDSRINKSRR